MSAPPAFPPQFYVRIFTGLASDRVVEKKDPKRGASPHSRWPPLRSAVRATRFLPGDRKRRFQPTLRARADGDLEGAGLDDEAHLPVIKAGVFRREREPDPPPLPGPEGDPLEALQLLHR